MTLYETLTKFRVESILSAILLLIAGFFIARLISVSITRTFIKRISPQQAMLLRRIIFYFIIAIFLVSAIQELGFHIGALLGAAGILTVAIGIASQTSMTNIISGIFMIGEKPFEVGDNIRVGDMQGDVLTIDLLSVRIRTQNNTMVRLPNEMLIKSSIVNLSYYPIRRADLKFKISDKEDFSRVKDILFEVANKNPLCLIEPKPLLQIIGLENAAVELQFSVWSTRGNFVDLKTSMYTEIIKAFTSHNIQSPFSTQTLLVGSGTEALPIKIISSE